MRRWKIAGCCRSARRSAAAGNLTITDNGANDTFVVSGDGTNDGKVTITGIGGTTVNGSSSASLTGVTGNIAMALGAGNVSVSVADLAVAKSLSITGGNGNDNVAIGAFASGTTSPTLASNAVTVGTSLVITLGNGTDHVTIGAVGGTGTDVSVGSTLAITVGKGADTITEDSTAVTGSESILAGAGGDHILIGTGAASVGVASPTVKSAVKSLVSTVKPAVTVTASPSTVAIGGSLVINVGSGNDTITEESLSVGGTNSIALGSGTNNVTIGTAAPVSPAVKAAVTGAAISQLVAEGGVSIGSDLDVLLGSGNTSVAATNMTVGDTILILGLPFSFGFGSTGVNFGFGLGSLFGGFSFGLGLGGIGGLFGSQTDTISLTSVHSEGVGIFPGFSATTHVNIQGSTFDDLGVGLGTGAGSLEIGGTTTFHSTTLVGLGTKNTYTGDAGNSFTKLVTFGLTPKPTTPT